ncbi:MAG: CAP domain-containing protein [Pyrinomonadaceae bacterium]
MFHMLCGALLTIAAVANATAQDGGELAALINDYRSAARACEGKKRLVAGPLAPNAALALVNVKPGTPLEDALHDAGYQAARVQAISVSGPAGARGVMEYLRRSYCGSLLSPLYSEIGVSRRNNTWHIVLAQPLVSTDLGDWQDAGMRVLELVNHARSKASACGRTKFPAAPPLDWNAKLAAAALAHSNDMAKRNYFSHVAPGGAEVGGRASRESYAWRRIGENIASGQGSPERVVSGWLASPSHCANIMNPEFIEMGAAYAVNPEREGTIYWTQVFGTQNRRRVANYTGAIFTIPWDKKSR